MFIVIAYTPPLFHAFGLVLDRFPLALKENHLLAIQELLIGQKNKSEETKIKLNLSFTNHNWDCFPPSYLHRYVDGEILKAKRC